MEKTHHDVFSLMQKCDEKTERTWVVLLLLDKKNATEGIPDGFTTQMYLEVAFL